MARASRLSRHDRWAGAAAAAAVVGAFLVAPTATAASEPAGQPAAEPPAERGHLVLVGGALNENGRILRQMVRLADPDGDGPATAHIAVVTAASYPAQNEEEAADPEQDNATANGIYYRELFARFGATTYLVPIDEAVNYDGDPYVPANADDARVAQSVHNSTGVWFGGGDQMRSVRTMFHCEPAENEAFTDCTDTIVMTAVRAVLDRGGVVGGTSAGLTIQQGPAMVTGGQSYEGWRGGATPGYYEGRRLGYVPYGGFGFFTYGQLDSHFATWSRQPRQIRLGMDPRVDVDRVFGLDETTALVVDREKQRGRVIGRNGASVLDMSEAELSNPDTRRASVSGVHWSYLTRGDRIDLASGRVRPARSSEELVGTGPAPPLKKDVWDTIEKPHTYAMRELGVALVSSAASKGRGITYEAEPRYRTTLVVAGGTRAWVSSRDVVSFDRLEIRIAPCCRAAWTHGAPAAGGSTGRRSADSR